MAGILRVESTVAENHQPDDQKSPPADVSEGTARLPPTPDAEKKSLIILVFSGRVAGTRLDLQDRIADDLWPEGALWPDGLVHHWLREQHGKGIGIKFVRESALQNEPELIADIGIYGSRAVGVQELDAQCRTVRFTLTFDFDQVQAAEERWQRLSDYAESFANYAERFASAS